MRKRQSVDSVYKYMIEQNGAEPMPMEVFKERKKTINELSKDMSETTFAQ